MNIGFFIFLFLIVILRSVFYRAVKSKSIISYVVLGCLEIGLLFTVFAMNIVMSWMTPALLLLLSLFQWSTETQFQLIRKQTETRDGITRTINFAVIFIALAIVFSSSRAPMVRGFLFSAGRYVTRGMLMAMAIGAIVTFEFDHLIRKPVATPVRLLVFLAVLAGAYLAAAMIAVASIVANFFIIHDRNDRLYTVRSHFVSISMSVLSAIVTLVLIG